MDLKLVSYVLSLILLVTYGTEARKMVEENSQFPLFYKHGAEDKHQQALKENTESAFPLFYKQGAKESQFPLFYKQGAEENSQFPLFYKQGAEENSQFPLFYKQGAEDKHQQALKENTESAFPLFYKQGAKESQFPLFYKQGAEENSQFPLFYKQGAEENSQFPLFYKQGAEDKHQQALKENTESAFPLFYKQGAKESQFPLFYKQGAEENSQFPLFYKQGAEENSQFPLFYKQGAEENSQFPLFYKQGAEDKHRQALKKNTESVFPLFYKQGAEENSQFPLFYKQGAVENSQFPLFYKQGAGDKHQQALKKNTESVYPLFYKQGAEDKHQQALKDNIQLIPFFYKQGAEDKHQQALKENAESAFPLFYKQGVEDKHQQALKDNIQLIPFFYKQGAEDKHQQALKENEHIHSSSHMDHIDPSQRIFFLMDDLKSWKAITISFSKRALASSLQFFPKEAADSIPFTLKELPNLLQRFSFSKDSPQAKVMEQTIRSCEDSPIKGETKVCATSMEAMLDFVHGIMGEKTQIEALTNTKTQEVEAIAAQNYTFLDAPQEVAAPKMVACHTLPSAYPVYYCHHTISKSKVFKVSLRNDANGDRIEAIALCHLDTSGWSPSHVAFRALGILPGTSPLCHFIPSDNLVWVPKTIANGHATL